MKEKKKQRKGKESNKIKKKRDWKNGWRDKRLIALVFRTWLVRVAVVEVIYEFGSIAEFCCRKPQVFLRSTFIA